MFDFLISKIGIKRSPSVVQQESKAPSERASNPINMVGKDSFQEISLEEKARRRNEIQVLLDRKIQEIRKNTPKSKSHNDRARMTEDRKAAAQRDKKIAELRAQFEELQKNMENLSEEDYSKYFKATFGIDLYEYRMESEQNSDLTIEDSSSDDIIPRPEDTVPKTDNTEEQTEENTSPEQEEARNSVDNTQNLVSEQELQEDTKEEVEETAAAPEIEESSSLEQGESEEMVRDVEAVDNKENSVADQSIPDSEMPEKDAPPQEEETITSEEKSEDVAVADNNPKQSVSDEERERRKTELQALLDKRIQEIRNNTPKPKSHNDRARMIEGRKIAAQRDKKIAELRAQFTQIQENMENLSEEDYNKYFKDTFGIEPDEYRREAIQDTAAKNSTVERIRTTNAALDNKNNHTTEEIQQRQGGVIQQRTEENKAVEQGLQDAKDEHGIFRKCCSYFVNHSHLFSSTEDSVLSAIGQDKKDIEELQQLAQSGDDIAFGRKYKQMTEVDFSVENFEKMEKAQKIYITTYQAHERREIEDYISYAEKNADYCDIPEEDRYSLDFDDRDKETGFEKQWPYSPLEQGLLRYFGNDKSKCLEYLERFGILENENASLKDKYEAVEEEFLYRLQDEAEEFECKPEYSGKSLKTLRKEYEQSIKDAYGNNIPQEKLNGYISNVERTYGLAKSAAAIGVAVATGGVGVVGSAAIVATTDAVINTVEESTDKNGLTAEDVGNITTEAAIEFGAFVIGGAVTQKEVNTIMTSANAALEKGEVNLAVDIIGSKTATGAVTGTTMGATAGAVSGAAETLINTPGEDLTLGGVLKNTLTSAIQGGIFGGLFGAAAGKFQEWRSPKDLVRVGPADKKAFADEIIEKFHKDVMDSGNVHELKVRMAVSDNPAIREGAIQLNMDITPDKFAEIKQSFHEAYLRSKGISPETAVVRVNSASQQTKAPETPIATVAAEPVSALVRTEIKPEFGSLTRKNSPHTAPTQAPAVRPKPKKPPVVSEPAEISAAEKSQIPQKIESAPAIDTVSTVEPTHVIESAPAETPAVPVVNDVVTEPVAAPTKPKIPKVRAVRKPKKAHIEPKRDTAEDTAVISPKKAKPAETETVVRSEIREPEIQIAPETEVNNSAVAKPTPAEAPVVPEVDVAEPAPAEVPAVHEADVVDSALTDMIVEKPPIIEEPVSAVIEKLITAEEDIPVNDSKVVTEELPSVRANEEQTPAAVAEPVPAEAPIVPEAGVVEPAPTEVTAVHEADVVDSALTDMIVEKPPIIEEPVSAVIEKPITAEEDIPVNDSKVVTEELPLVRANEEQTPAAVAEPAPAEAPVVPEAGVVEPAPTEVTVVPEVDVAELAPVEAPAVPAAVAEPAPAEVPAVTEVDVVKAEDTVPVASDNELSNNVPPVESASESADAVAVPPKSAEKVSLTIDEKMQIIWGDKLSNEEMNNPVLRHNTDLLFEVLKHGTFGLERILSTRKIDITPEIIAGFTSVEQIACLRKGIKRGFPVEVIELAGNERKSIAGVEEFTPDLNLGEDKDYGKSLVEWYQDTTENSGAVNKALRKSEPLSEKAQEVVDFLDTHQRPLGRNRGLIRGTNDFPGMEFSKMQPGDEFTDLGFSSTTHVETFPDFIDSFADEVGHDSKHFLIIKTPANQKVIVPADWTGTDIMGEIILPRGTRFRVLENKPLTDYGNTGRPAIEGRRVIVVEIVPDTPMENIPNAAADSRISETDILSPNVNNDIVLEHPPLPATVIEPASAITAPSLLTSQISPTFGSLTGIKTGAAPSVNIEVPAADGQLQVTPDPEIPKVIKTGTIEPPTVAASKTAQADLTVTVPSSLVQPTVPKPVSPLVAPQKPLTPVDLSELQSPSAKEMVRLGGIPRYVSNGQVQTAETVEEANIRAYNQFREVCTDRVMKTRSETALMESDLSRLADMLKAKIDEINGRLTEVYDTRRPIKAGDLSGINPSDEQALITRLQSKYRGIVLPEDIFRQFAQIILNGDYIKLINAILNERDSIAKLYKEAMTRLSRFEGELKRLNNKVAQDDKTSHIQTDGDTVTIRALYPNGNVEPKDTITISRADLEAYRSLTQSRDSFGLLPSLEDDIHVMHRFFQRVAAKGTTEEKINIIKAVLKKLHDAIEALSRGENYEDYMIGWVLPPGKSNRGSISLLKPQGDGNYTNFVLRYNESKGKYELVTEVVNEDILAAGGKFYRFKIKRIGDRMIIESEGGPYEK